MDYSEINEAHRIFLAFEAENYPRKAQGILVHPDWYKQAEYYLLKNISNWGSIVPTERCIKMFGVKLFRTIDIQKGDFIAF